VGAIPPLPPSASMACSGTALPFLCQIILGLVSGSTVVLRQYYNIAWVDNSETPANGFFLVSSRRVKSPSSNDIEPVTMETGFRRRK
jgi:hypothetical protein